MSNKIARFFIGMVLLASVIGLAGCGGPKPVTVTKADSGSTVTLAEGQDLVIELESNPSTGYTWEVKEIDPGVLEQAGDPEYKQPAKSDPQLVGQGGTQVFTFHAAGKGTTIIQLIYHRTWEKDVEPAETFSLTVTVQ
jgi:inhibitor of cysteine peptidase